MKQQIINYLLQKIRHSLINIVLISERERVDWCIKRPNNMLNKNLEIKWVQHQNIKE